MGAKAGRIVPLLGSVSSFSSAIFIWFFPGRRAPSREITVFPRHHSDDEPAARGVKDAAVTNASSLQYTLESDLGTKTEAKGGL